MATMTKRTRMIRENVKGNTSYSTKEALELLKKLSTVKFVESVDVSVNLGIDPKKSDQTIRRAVVLPKGTGREVKVAVFAQADKAEAAKKAGADIVGFEDLFETIKAGNIDFDILIAAPDAMPMVGKLGTILGPRGLMPNPKVGTVTPDVAAAVKNAKTGQVHYRTDKAGIVHCRIGTAKFSVEDLKENLEALVADIKKAKPSTSKGIYLKKMVLTTTMGPGIMVDINSLENA